MRIWEAAESELRPKGYLERRFHLLSIQLIRSGLSPESDKLFLLFYVKLKILHLSGKGNLRRA
jgi:hypothetical protein